jgi:hypothetical protein
MTKLARIAPNDQEVVATLTLPGSLGLNTVESQGLIDASYATLANNCIIDTQGRLSARNGIAQVSTGNFGGFSGNFISSLFEYNAGGGTYYDIAIWSGPAVGDLNTAYPYLVQSMENVAVAGSSSSYTASAGLLGTKSLPTGAGKGNRVYMQNFNNKCIAFVKGKVPWVLSGDPAANAFTAITASAGSVPVTNGVGYCGFGRVWAVCTDNQTIYYSGLLDETNWASPSSGLIDMHTIWSNGTDQVTAIFAFNSALVVCGTKHIVLFTDGTGSLLGLNPVNAYVFDVLAGTGCLSQWTVDFIGQSDVVFLSPYGVQSMQRLSGGRDNPTGTLTKYVRDDLLAALQAENVNFVSGKYNNQTGQYLLTLPVSQLVYCLDVRRIYQDSVGERCARITKWPIQVTDVLVDHLYNVTFGLAYNPTVPQYVSAGIGWQTQYTDFKTGAFTYQWQSPWLDFSQELGDGAKSRLKLLKRYETQLFAASTASCTLTWNTDFSLTPQTAAITIGSTSGQSSEFGIAQFGYSNYPTNTTYANAGFGGTLTLGRYFYDGRASGQFYQFGLSATVAGSFALQQVQYVAKLGRTV